MVLTNLYSGVYKQSLQLSIFHSLGFLFARIKLQKLIHQKWNPSIKTLNSEIKQVNEELTFVEFNNNCHWRPSLVKLE